MNPQLDQTPGLGLPQPSFELGQVPANQAAETFHAPDAIAPKFDSMSPPMPATAAPTQIPQPMLDSLQPLQSAPTPLPVVPIQSAPAIPADDTDSDSALDDEWVNKAREIVERTHSDPYLQSKELSKIKAQYIKVRYNKDIKNSEDQTE